MRIRTGLDAHLQSVKENYQQLFDLSKESNSKRWELMQVRLNTVGEMNAPLMDLYCHTTTSI